MRLLRAAKHGFMAFWYFHARTLNALLPSVTLQGTRLAVFPGVYKPLENEQACSDYCHAGDRVLDLGCGSGVATVFCAPKVRDVVAVDISLPAIRNTEENCRRHGLKNVRVMQSDMFARVEGKFDLILANAPYIEDEFAAEDRQFATSRRFLSVLFTEAANHMEEDGRLLIQFPLKSRRHIEMLAAENDLEIVSSRRLPPKGVMLSLLSILYLQVGFRSALFLLRRRGAAAVAKPATRTPAFPHAA